MSINLSAVAHGNHLSSTLRIHVFGTPAPQGSKSFKGMRAGHPILVESSKKVGPWRAAVVAAARSAMNRASMVMITDPVEVALVFWLQAPQRMPVGRWCPSTYPDVSKLARSTEDALVDASVLADDALIVRYSLLEKRYAPAGHRPGASITVTTLPAVLAGSPNNNKGERA